MYTRLRCSNTLIFDNFDQKMLYCLFLRQRQGGRYYVIISFSFSGILSVAHGLLSILVPPTAALQCSPRRQTDPTGYLNDDDCDRLVHYLMMALHEDMNQNCIVTSLTSATVLIESVLTNEVLPSVIAITSFSKRGEIMPHSSPSFSLPTVLCNHFLSLPCLLHQSIILTEGD